MTYELLAFESPIDFGKSCPNNSNFISFLIECSSDFQVMMKAIKCWTVLILEQLGLLACELLAL